MITTEQAINLHWLMDHLAPIENLSGQDVPLLQYSHESMHEAGGQLYADADRVRPFVIPALPTVARVVHDESLSTIIDLPPYRFGHATIVTLDVLRAARAQGRDDGDLFVLGRKIHD